MDMHIPHALLQIAQEPGPYRVANRPDYFFSEQLSASYEAAQHALWIRWTPSPRPSFNPEVLRSLDRCAQFIRAGDGFIRAGDELVPEAEDTADPPAPPMPIEYTVLSSGVPGRVQSGWRPRSVPASDRSAGIAPACWSTAPPAFTCCTRTTAPRAADHHHFAGPGRVPGRRVRSRAVERHRDRRKACRASAFPEILFNLFPGMGAYSFLDRRVGRRVTEELLSTGKIYSADDMLAMGVIDRVVDSGQGEAEVAALIRRQSRNRNGLLGIAAVRRRVNPVTFQELLGVVHLWADCALRLSSRDLKLMQRLVSRQNDIARGRRH